MFVYNRCTSDARVLKEAATLRRAGHEVQIVAVLDATTVPLQTLADGTRIVRIDRRPLHYRLVWATQRARRRVRWALRVPWRIAYRLSGRAPRERPAPPPPAGPTAPRSSLLRRTLYRAHKPLMFADYYWRAYRHVRHQGFDRLHAHDLNTMPVAVALRRATGAALVFDAHELYPDISTLSPREARVWRTLEGPLARRATAAATVCDSIADVLADRCRVARPTVVLNCPERQPPVARGDSPLRALAGLAGGDEPLILYQGGFSPNRGLPSLVRAMHHVDRGVLVLMGWGRLEDELRDLVVAEGLRDRVRLLPAVPRHELLRHTAGADVGVIPYEAVGLNNTYSTPNKLFEYLAAGVPVAATRLPEIARIVDGERLGATFATVEPRAIAAAVTAVLDDEDGRDGTARRIAAARERYTWEAQEPRLLGLYAERPGPASRVPGT